MPTLTEMLAELEAKATDAKRKGYFTVSDVHAGPLLALIAAVREVVAQLQVAQGTCEDAVRGEREALSELDDAQRRLAEVVASNVRLIKEMDAQGQALFIADQILGGENLSVMKAERNALKIELAEAQEKYSEWHQEALVRAQRIHELEAKLAECERERDTATECLKAEIRKCDEIVHQRDDEMRRANQIEELLSFATEEKAELREQLREARAQAEADKRRLDWICTHAQLVAANSTPGLESENRRRLNETIDAALARSEGETDQ